MAKEKTKKTGHKPHQFQPGQSGNPKGREPYPPEIKAIKLLNKDYYRRVMTKFIQLTPTEIAKALKDPKATALEHMIGTIVSKAISTGDHAKLGFLLDRLIGKVTDKVEIGVKRPFIIEKLDGGKVELGAATIDAEVIDEKTSGS
jgi:hypothetical protein